MRRWSSERLCGIYKIININTGKFYLGGSVNIYSRWRLHLHELRKNDHPNARLQNTFNKHGESAFTFTIIELCEPENLTTREQFYLDTIKPYINGYNIAMGAARVMIGFKHSKESIAKMSKSQLELNKRFPNRLKGKVISQETRDKISKTLTGFRHSEESKRKIGLASKARGNFSQQHIENMRKAQKGKVISQQQREDIRRALTGRKPSPESIEKRKKTMIALIAKAREENGGVVPWFKKALETKRLNRLKKQTNDVLSK